jgi:hypothetical protein
VPGGQELIGRLDDRWTPIKIMQYARKGHEIKIVIALSPKKPTGANYIWGELPQNLPPGRYHVEMTGAEYEEHNGHLVLAPKTDIRAFFQYECYFAVGETAAQDVSWHAQDKAVADSFEHLAERLKFLQADFQNPEFGPRVYQTACGDMVGASYAFHSNWDAGMPRKPPPAGTFGTMISIYAYRSDSNVRPGQLPIIAGQVTWDGKSESRMYAFDKDEFGWKATAIVEGNNSEITKRVNGIIDEELTRLSSALSAVHTAPATSP